MFTNKYQYLLTFFELESDSFVILNLSKIKLIPTPHDYAE